MPDPPIEFDGTLVHAWRICDRATRFLVESLPDEAWGRKLPGMPRRTIRMIAGHIHDARCTWIGKLGGDAGVEAPAKADRHRASRQEVVAALEQSGPAVARLLHAGLAGGGTFPGRPAWMNLQPDAVHFAVYLASHEAHHRGQIVLLSRQLGFRLPDDVAYGLWQWKKRAAEIGG